MSLAPTIRPIRIEDAEDVLRVHYDAVHETAAADYDLDTRQDWSPPVTAERIESFARTIGSGEKTTLVAELDGRVVGFSSIVPAMGELEALYVAPQAGRRGIGFALLSAIENLASEMGLKELSLNSSLTAERFYMAHGYRAEGKDWHTLESGRKMACIGMRKALRS